MTMSILGRAALIVVAAASVACSDDGGGGGGSGDNGSDSGVNTAPTTMTISGSATNTTTTTTTGNNTTTTTTTTTDGTTGGTGMGTGSSGGGSTGTTGGMAVAYDACDAMMMCATAGEQCATRTLDNSSGFCSQSGCMVAGDCPANPDGASTATVECGIDLGGMVMGCFLSCDAINNNCPMGMICVDDGMATACEWV